MGKPGVLLYKCRLCGEVSANPHVADALRALTLVIFARELPPEWGPLTPQTLTTHRCGDGRIGVADLVGCREDA